MLKNFQARSRPIHAASSHSTANILRDFLEMRAGLSEEKRDSLLAHIGRRLEFSGDIQPLPAFMVGSQAVLCIKEVVPSSYWIYNLSAECLHPSKGPDLFS